MRELKCPRCGGDHFESEETPMVHGYGDCSAMVYKAGCVGCGLDAYVHIETSGQPFIFVATDDISVYAVAKIWDDSEEGFHIVGGDHIPDVGKKDGEYKCSSCGRICNEGFICICTVSTGG